MKQLLLTTALQTAHTKMVERVTDLIIGIIIVLAVGIILLHLKRRRKTDD